MTSVMEVVFLAGLGAVGPALASTFGLLLLRDQAFRHEQGRTSPIVDALADRLRRGSRS